MKTDLLELLAVVIFFGIVDLITDYQPILAALMSVGGIIFFAVRIFKFFKNFKAERQKLKQENQKLAKENRKLEKENQKIDKENELLDIQIKKERKNLLDE